MMKQFATCILTCINHQPIHNVMINFFKRGTVHVGLIAIMLVSLGLSPSAIGPDDLTEEMAKKIWQSPERKHFDQVRIEGLRLIESALRQGVSKEDLVGAFKVAEEGKSQVLEGLLFSDKGKAEAFYSAQTSAYEALTTRFPILLTIAENPDNGAICTPSTTPSQRIDALFSVASDDGIGFQEVISQAEAKAQADTPCGDWRNLLAYSACLAVCTSGGPVLYWPCAALCVCAFCPEGDVLGLCPDMG